MNNSNKSLDSDVVVNLGFPEKFKKGEMDPKSFPSKLGGKPVK
jgi:hypothetical protein